MKNGATPQVKLVNKWPRTGIGYRLPIIAQESPIARYNNKKAAIRLLFSIYFEKIAFAAKCAVRDIVYHRIWNI